VGEKITQVTLAPGKVLVQEDSKPKIPKPNFIMVGNGTTNRYGITSIDLLYEMAMMTKPALFTLLRIREELHWENITGEVKVPMNQLTSAQKQQFKRGYKELLAKDLVRRTKRSHYMINPNALIPKEYTLGLELWDSLTHTQDS
jgi:hypothetical protein